MTESEYLALEKRIEERQRVRSMAEDLAKSKKESIYHRASESIRATKRGDKPWLGDGGGVGHAKTSGGAFERTQIEING